MKAHNCFEGEFLNIKQFVYPLTYISRSALLLNYLFLICRSEYELPEEERAKIALFTNVASVKFIYLPTIAISTAASGE
jgi:hypothetical protein